MEMTLYLQLEWTGLDVLSNFATYKLQALSYGLESMENSGVSVLGMDYTVKKADFVRVEDLNLINYKIQSSAPQCKSDLSPRTPRRLLW